MAVGKQGGPRLHIGPHESLDRCGRIICDHGKADTTRPGIEVFGPFAPAWPHWCRGRSPQRPRQRGFSQRCPDRRNCRRRETGSPPDRLQPPLQGVTARIDHRSPQLLRQLRSYRSARAHPPTAAPTSVGSVDISANPNQTVSGSWAGSAGPQDRRLPPQSEHVRYARLFSAAARPCRTPQTKPSATVHKTPRNSPRRNALKLSASAPATLPFTQAIKQTISPNHTLASR